MAEMPIETAFVAQPVPPASQRRRVLRRLVAALAVLPAMSSIRALLDGSTFRPAQADGQVLVIYWWASWCPFCAVQSPLMDRLWREQRGRGLEMLALSIDRKAEDASAYLARHGYVFPSGHVTPAVAQALPKPRGLPVTLVRGRDGKVLLAEAGQMFPEDVEAIADFL